MNTEQITLNTHSSIRIGGSRVIYFDPFQITAVSEDADLIFITHSHFDHFDRDSIGKILKAGTVLAAPADMEAELLETAPGHRIVPVKPGDSLTAEGVAFCAVPAYNLNKKFHPKANGWTGYLVTLDEVCYYIAGDTDALDELREISCDIALVPIGGTYTMTAEEAAGLVNSIRPKTAIPTHYGSVVGSRKDADRFRKLVGPGIEVITKL